MEHVSSENSSSGTTRRSTAMSSFSKCSPSAGGVPVPGVLAAGGGVALPGVQLLAAAAGSSPGEGEGVPASSSWKTGSIQNAYTTAQRAFTIQCYKGQGARGGTRGGKPWGQLQGSVSGPAAAGRLICRHLQRKQETMRRTGR